MDGNYSTQGVRNILFFLFRDSKRASKLAIAIGLTLAGFILPIVPQIFFLGYLYEVMSRAAAGDGELVLPDWNDWGRLGKNGLKFFGVNLVYSAPMLIILFVGIAAYILPFVFIAILGERASDSMIGFAMIGLLVFFLCQLLATLMSFLVGIFSTVALGNMAAQDRFAAGFEFRKCWQIFRANPGGYLLSYMILMGGIFCLLIASQVMYMTIVLCAVIPVIIVLGIVYFGLVGAGLFGRAYREAQEKLDDARSSSQLSAVSSQLNEEIC